VRAGAAKTLNVAVLHAADRTDDARYVRAAVAAVGESLGRPINISDTVGSADWIFWLNDHQPSAEVMKRATEDGATLLVDAENSGGTTLQTSTSIETAEFSDGVALFRRTTPMPSSGVALWTDGFGMPLLTAARNGAGRRLSFFSRFHPDWNDLPRSSALPAALRPLLIGEDPSAKESGDERRVDNSQIRPSESRAATPEFQLASAAGIIDLHTLVWVLCLALFAAERVLSHRRASARRVERLRTDTQQEPAMAGHV
jgi:hypothetical protein